jgi:hypothetical protein
MSEPYFENPDLRRKYGEVADYRVRLARCVQTTQAENPGHPKLARAKEVLRLCDAMLVGWEELSSDGQLKLLAGAAAE